MGRQGAMLGRETLERLLALDDQRLRVRAFTTVSGVEVTCDQVRCIRSELRVRIRPAGS